MYNRMARQKSPDLVAFNNFARPSVRVCYCGPLRQALLQNIEVTRRAKEAHEPFEFAAQSTI
jgi:hypothetical protein